MIKWLGGTFIALVALVIVIKYPQDVEQLIKSFLLLVERVADGLHNTYQDSQAKGTK